MNRTKPSRLLAEERRREIADLLDQAGRVTVEDIVRHFKVSAVTARGDLDALAAAGALVRTHGGALQPLAGVPDHPLKVREKIFTEQKIRIAEAAVDLIKPGQTIILCTGSTSVEVARCLRRRMLENLTVITYALNIASLLADLNGLSLIMIGGILRQVSNAFVGPQAEGMMHSLHADHCFLSTVGLDLRVGLTTLDIMEAQLNRCLIEHTAETSVVADSSKFGVRSLSVITDFGPLHRVITDQAAPPDAVQELRTRGLDVILA